MHADIQASGCCCCGRHLPAVLLLSCLPSLFAHGQAWGQAAGMETGGRRGNRWQAQRQVVGAGTGGRCGDRWQARGQVGHDMDMGQPMEFWSRVVTGAGAGLCSLHPHTTIPLPTGYGFYCHGSLQVLSYSFTCPRAHGNGFSPQCVHSHQSE
jgi:hypothetical protein